MRHKFYKTITIMNKILEDLKKAHWSEQGNEGRIMRGLAYIIEALEKEPASEPGKGERCTCTLDETTGWTEDINSSLKRCNICGKEVSEPARGEDRQILEMISAYNNALVNQVESLKEQIEDFSEIRKQLSETSTECEMLKHENRQLNKQLEEKEKQVVYHSDYAIRFKNLSDALEAELAELKGKGERKGEELSRLWPEYFAEGESEVGLPNLWEPDPMVNGKLVPNRGEERTNLPKTEPVDLPQEGEEADEDETIIESRDKWRTKAKVRTERIIDLEKEIERLKVWPDENEVHIAVSIVSNYHPTANFTPYGHWKNAIEWLKTFKPKP